MEAMEGAPRNHPEISIFDVNNRPKGEVAPECYYGMNCGMSTSFKEGTYGRRYWCCQNIKEVTSSSEGSSRTRPPATKACHFIEWIDDSISWKDQMHWDEMKAEQEEGRRAAQRAKNERAAGERLKKEIEDIRREYRRGG
ncbi:unnamed protein product [Urochloa humidicola]